MCSLNIHARVSLFLLVSSSLLSVALYSTRAPCYFPDFTVAQNFAACSSTAKGECCFENDICTDWGDCLSQTTGHHYRGACTDSTWEDHHVQTIAWAQVVRLFNRHIFTNIDIFQLAIVQSWKLFHAG